MYLEDYNYALCYEHTKETSTHLFWDCPFALMCWHSITPNKHRGMSTYDEIHLCLSALPPEFAMDMIVLGCWSIWMSRNDKIFRRATPMIDKWKFYLKDGLRGVELRAKTDKADKIHTWILNNL